MSAVRPGSLTDVRDPPAEIGMPIFRRHRPRGAWYLAATAVGIAVILSVAGYGLGWFKNGGSRITLLGEGASFILPLMTQWENSYRPADSSRINYNPAGAGAGITALSDRVVDFAATDDPLTGTRLAGGQSPVLTLPIAAGALAIVYNLPGLPAPLQLSGGILAEIYLGHISSWDDSKIRALNPGLPLLNPPIATVHRLDAAGATFVLTDYLSQDSSNWSAGPGKGVQISWPSTPAPAQAVRGNSPLAVFVSKNPYTIGYADLPDVLLTPGLAYAKIGNPSGRFVLPDLADTLSAIANKSRGYAFPASWDSWENVSMVNAPGGSDYPIATFAYFFVYQSVEAGYAPSLQKAQALLHWLLWVIADGQNLSGTLSYARISPTIVQIDRTGISSMTFGGRTAAAWA